MNTKIYAMDKSFDIGCKVIKWDEPGGLSFEKHPKNFMKHKVKNFEELQKNIKQLTLHWSATYKAKNMHDGLIARGLSANFYIDDDCNPDNRATIYQALPIEHAGYSQGPGLNILGSGIEIAYQPLAGQEDWYDEHDRKKWRVPEHKSTEAVVHGVKMKVHLPTEAQMNSLKALIWGYCRLFPDLPMKFPRNEKGEFLTTVLKKPKDYNGLCCHYNLSRNKIDPIGIDLADLEKDLEERSRFGY
jgi:hypothetical protein